MKLILYLGLMIFDLVASNTIIMVVMGCSIPEIQEDRIHTAIKYTERLSKNTDIIWFLTGGVKYKMQGISEALQMQSHLPIDANIVLDTRSTNSAENFANLKKWILPRFDLLNFPKIVITTSEFHKKRASLLFKGIWKAMPLDIYNHSKWEWNLGKYACSNSWSYEVIHIQNAENDILRALQLLDF